MIFLTSLSGLLGSTGAIAFVVNEKVTDLGVFSGAVIFLQRLETASPMSKVPPKRIGKVIL